jgi:DNA-binding Xre family transcriptional regulator
MPRRLKTVRVTTTPATRTDSLTVGVAEEVRSLMGRRKVTGAQLAKRLGVSAAWVSYRVNGLVSPSVDDLERIAEALGVEIVDLIPRSRRQVTVTSINPPLNRPPNRPHGGRPVTYAGASGPGRTSRASH